MYGSTTVSETWKFKCGNKAKVTLSLFDRSGCFDMAVYKQANACCSPFTKCQLIPILGKLLCYENNLKPKDLVLCVARNPQNKSKLETTLARHCSFTLIHSVQFECVGNTFGEGITLKVFMMRSGYSSRI